MALTAHEIRNQTFTIAKKGYDRGEVHRFLGHVANEIDQAIHSAASDAVVIDDGGPQVIAAVIEPSPTEIELTAPAAPIVDMAPAEAPAAVAPVASSFDEFDRVGSEISTMLRQAQESAAKIRNEAEVEAQALLEQVTNDIETDRAAHEKAAKELIARTEERAAALRADAEAYSNETKRAADEYAATQRADADRARADANAAVEADRSLATERLEAANREAEATVSNANERATEIVTTAETQAQATTDDMLSEARDTLSTFAGTEESSRANLEQLRSTIDHALSQLRVTDIDTTSLAS